MGLAEQRSGSLTRLLGTGSSQQPPVPSHPKGLSKRLKRFNAQRRLSHEHHYADVKVSSRFSRMKGSTLLQVLALYRFRLNDNIHILCCASTLVAAWKMNGH